MEYKVVVLNSAQREIEHILDYLLNVLKSRQAALSFLEELDHQIELLKNNPDIFAVSRIPELAAKSYHVSIIKNYLMLYTVRDDYVYIAHVFHQTQDYAKLV